MFEAIVGYDKKAIDDQLIGDVYKMVKYSERYDYNYKYELTYKVLKVIINYLNKQIEEKTKANNVYTK